MDYKAIEKRLLAAQSILETDTLNRATFDSLKTLLSGVCPRLDNVLAQTAKAFKHADQLQKGDGIELAIEGLPEMTPEQKKRKKAILLFLKLRNDLKSEVVRVKKEFAKDTHTKHHANAWGAIVAGAKGPLGIVTLIAVGVVTLKMTEVSVTIKNMGCEPISPITNVSITIPGLKLPNGVIPTGGEAVAKLPPVTITVDATSSNMIRLNAYGIRQEFSLGSSRMRFVFDGAPLNGTSTSIRLGSQKEYVLVVQCE